MSQECQWCSNATVSPSGMLVHLRLGDIITLTVALNRAILILAI